MKRATTKKKAKSSSKAGKAADSPSRLIDSRIEEMSGWRESWLPDPSGLFNSSLEGNTRRAIDIHEGEKIDVKALKALIRAAVARNTSARAAPRPARARKRA